LAGPVTIALVAFSREVLSKIYNREILPGLDDSKKVSSHRREFLATEIRKWAQSFSVVHVSSRFIDCHNINEAIFYGILKALKLLRCKNPFLILDGNYNWKNSQQPKPYPESVSIPKADSTIASVQAASILAKVSRDRLMNAFSRKYPLYRFERHKGYGTSFHLEAIKKYGILPIHRKTFLRNLEGVRIQ